MDIDAIQDMVHKDGYKQINENKFYFHFLAVINIQKKSQ